MSLSAGGPTGKRIALGMALTALLAVIFMPTPVGLPPAGQVMLGILAFAVVVWMTERSTTL